MIYIKGDATRPIGTGHKIIPHICNDQGAWGAGFTHSLSKRWTEPEAAYRASDHELGDVEFVRVEPDIDVANMVAQIGIRGQRGFIGTHYEILADCLEIVGQVAETSGSSVHMPRIGCGLGGGSWDLVEPIIHKMLVAREIPVTVYDL